MNDSKLSVTPVPVLFRIRETTDCIIAKARCPPVHQKDRVIGARDSLMVLRGAIQSSDRGKG